MNFQAVKIMVEELINVYKCPKCSSSVTEANLDIMGTAGSNINIDIICPKCNSHDIIKGQMLALNINTNIQVENKNINKIENLKEKLEKFENFKGKVEDIELAKNSLIKDSTIVELNKNLKSKNFSISELFSEN